MSLLFLGSDIHAPSTSMESKMAAQLGAVAAEAGIATRMISIQVTKQDSGKEGCSYVRGPASGPWFYRKSIFAMRLVRAVWSNLAGQRNGAVVHFLWSGAPLVMRFLVFLCHRRAVPVVITCLGPNSPASWYRAADVVVAQSPKNFRRLSAELSAGVAVRLVRPYADPGIFKPTDGPVQAYFVVASGPFTTGQIAELGVEALFQAFGKLARTDVPVGLRYVTRWLAGIPLLEDIRARYQAENIEILTGVREDIPALMARAAGVIVPFANGADVPMSALEALSSGVPVIATDVLGLANEIREYGAGLVIPADDPAALTQAVVTVLGDPGGMRRNALRLAALHSQPEFRNAYLDIYTGLGLDVACG